MWMRFCFSVRLCVCVSVHVHQQYSSCVRRALIQTAGTHLFLLLLLRPVAYGVRCTGMRCLGLDQWWGGMHSSSVCVCVWMWFMATKCSCVYMRFCTRLVYLCVWIEVICVDNTCFLCACVVRPCVRAGVFCGFAIITFYFHFNNLVISYGKHNLRALSCLLIACAVTPMMHRVLHKWVTALKHLFIYFIFPFIVHHVTHRHFPIWFQVTVITLWLCWCDHCLKTCVQPDKNRDCDVLNRRGLTVVFHLGRKCIPVECYVHEECDAHYWWGKYCVGSFHLGNWEGPVWWVP